MNIKNKYPLVKTFNLNKYNLYGLYDGRVNSFVLLSESEFKVVEKKIKGDTQELSTLDNNIIIERLNKLGFLVPGIRESRVDSSDRNVIDVINYSEQRASLRKLTLEITDKCNLRCKYCRYTINEMKENGKSHSNKVMDANIYIKAINSFIAEYCRRISLLPKELQESYLKKNPPIIGIYGGEVLIYKKIVRQLIDYIRNINFFYDNKYISIAITTNGTLLDEDFINFCVEQDIYLQISVDGPKSEHDKNRVFSSGQGSFEKVNKAITFLRNEHPNYFSSNVSFQAVEAPNYNRHNVINYFKEMNRNGRFSGANSFRFLEFADYYESPSGYNFKQNKSKRFSNDFFYSLIDIVKKYEELNEDESSLINAYSLNIELKELFNKVFDTLTKIFEKPLIEYNFFNSCYLLKANAFVSCEGSVHICERTDFSFPLGSIEEGIDRDKVFYLYKEFFNIMNSLRCRTCWAASLCPICVAQLIEKGRVVPPDNNKCKLIRNNYELYMTILFVLSINHPRTYNAIQEMFSISTDASLDEFLSNRD